MDLQAIARRFPLVSRSRPPGLTLQARVAELRKIAQESARLDDHERVTRASEVCNKAALIASDCALPELARELCWRQYDAFTWAGSLPVWAAKLALQPVLNIARQLIREGDGDGAYRILHQLFYAALNRTEAKIAGRRVGLREVTGTPGDHETVTKLLWAALLADGARALALAGRWQEAAEHAAKNRGVGTRLLDGRQVTILALADRGQLDQAIAMVQDSMTAEPWEEAVASLLRVYCQRAADADTKEDLAAMIRRALKLVEHADPSTTVFRTRIGITALDLAGYYDSALLQRLRQAVVGESASDAYAGREVLAHPELRPMMTVKQRQGLEALVQESGLGGGSMPHDLLRDLMSSVTMAERRLQQVYSGSPR
ncbi:hypothetical protein [Nonomuraea sp. LPB2021202275-12-8]|uniref:hypothetical protein n=1 Tax=Nonomuraea sp. LPB2021202275-12-8 TaxID=3120159 RepID=UPI00300C2DB0